MRFEDYRRYDAVGLAQLVARREVSAGEVLEAALARMAEVNPRINAVIMDLSESARRTAAAPPPGPLSGVPYLLKDHGAMLAGVPTTMSCEVFRDNIPAADNALVAALKDAGLVIFGKTNVPEMSNSGATEPRMHGATRNPWDLGRSPAGSSGGSAAAVAAGIVPAAHASDGGGSIRGPASVTGLFGFKPSRGRVSLAPNNPGPGGFVVAHALTRSVRDSALLLDVASTPQVGDRYWLPRPERPFLEEAAREPGRLRIAFHTGSLKGEGPDPDIVQGVRDAAQLCADLGHDVEEIVLTEDYKEAGASSVLANAASIAYLLDTEAARRGRPVEESELEPITWLTYLAGRNVTASDYIRDLQTSYAFGRKVAEFLSRYDVILEATTGCTALRVGELYEEPIDYDVYRRKMFKLAANTLQANVGGVPAMSVPLGWSSEGLPFGIQFTASLGQEALLFRLAGQLEQARPWADRSPAGL